MMFVVAFGLLQAASPDTFAVQADIQGRYAEISQATLQFATEQDVDDFHDVMYTSDWAVTDVAGQRHEWAQLRAEALQALTAPRLDAMVQSIQTFSLTPSGATAVVNVTTVRTVIDAEGRYGPKDATHRLNETTSYRDTWVRVGDGWRLKAREQLALHKVQVDKPEYEP